jgi:anti-anti-sigma factor
VVRPRLVHRVRAVAQVDLATAPMLRDRLLSMLREQTPAVLDIDLAGVGFLDCAGISALVAARNAAVHTGRQMRITHPQPIVRRVMDVTGLLGMLTTPARADDPSRTATTPRDRLSVAQRVGYRLTEAPTSTT